MPIGVKLRANFWLLRGLPWYEKALGLRFVRRREEISVAPVVAAASWSAAASLAQTPLSRGGRAGDHTWVPSGSKVGCRGFVCIGKRVEAVGMRKRRLCCARRRTPGRCRDNRCSSMLTLRWEIRFQCDSGGRVPSIDGQQTDFHPLEIESTVPLT